MDTLGFIAIVTKDNWHIANGQHFGDIVYDYKLSKVFTNEMDAIKNAWDVLCQKYEGIEIVSKKGLQQKWDNELNYFGREFHIICMDIYKEDDGNI